MNTSTSLTSATLSNHCNQQSVVVNGVTITPEITDILSQWFDKEGNIDYLNVHINACINIQDFLCELITTNDISDVLIEKIRIAMIGIMSKKMTLKI